MASIYVELLNIILDVPIVNFSNFTSDGIFHISFYVYLVLFHDLFWGILGGIIGGGLYAQKRSLGTLTLFLVIWGTFFAIVLPEPVAPIFGLILAFALAVTFYRTFVDKQ